MVDTFERGLDDAERFAINKTNEAIKRDVLGTSIRALGEAGGEGFPEVYIDHLIRHMRYNTHISSNTFGNGQMEIEVTFSNMGDYDDLARGFHDGALIQEETGAHGYGKLSGKPKYNIHPPQVQLPYNGEPLMNEQERRQEFWEQAVVDGEPFQTDMKGLTVTAPSFGEVAYNRVSAWEGLGVAPEWLLLEYGYTESRPEVSPVDFTNSLESIINCVASEIYTGAVVALIKIAQDAGESIRVVGTSAPRSGRTGRFVAYKEALAEVETDYSHCLFSF